jgi:PIN domain nuclease of toxin-antitoxin system
MNSPLLLDTNICIWLVEGTVRPATETLLAERANAGESLYVSPFTAWELGAILRRGKLRTPLDAGEYFRRLASQPGMALADLTPDILIAAWYLPGKPPNDPADRIMVATARALDLTLLTRDRELLAYAAEGHLRAIPC